MQKLVVKLAVFLLKKNLKLENRSLLINGILDKLSALPLKSIISVSENGFLQINGKELDREELKIIIESAHALRANRVFGIIQDQVLFQALSFGLTQSAKIEDIYFSKAAVWWGQEENKLLKALSGEMPDQS